MSAPKEQLLRKSNEELVKKLVTTLKSEEFETLLVFSLAEFQSRAPTVEQGTGVNMFIRIMKTIIDDDKETPSWNEVMKDVTLEHNLEIDRTTNQENKNKK